MANSTIDEKKPASSVEMEKLRRWRSEFTLDFRAHQNWFTTKRKWEDFYDGEQLSAKEKEILAGRNQPEVVINRIKPRIDGVIGDFLGRRVMMRARDRGAMDFDKAKHITEALRYVEDQNRFDEAETQVAEDLFIGGVGWYKIALEFDFLEPEIKISYRCNNDIVVDRRSRNRDLSDAKRLYETIWVEAEDLIEIYPDFEEEIRAATEMSEESFNSQYGPINESRLGDNYATSDNVTADIGTDFETFLDPNRKRIRVINVWWDPLESTCRHASLSIL